MKFIKVFLLVMVGLMLIFSLFWWKMGLRYFAGVAQQVYKLPTDQKVTAEAMFWGNGQTGIVARVDVKGSKLWLWGKMGLSSYQFDYDSALIQFRVCEQDVLQKIGANESFEPNQYVTSDLSKWAGWVKQGDYVGFGLRRNSDGKLSRTISEIRAFDCVKYPFYIPKINRQNQAF